MERSDLETQYAQLVQQTIARARAGDVDAFGAFVLRDHKGLPIELAPIHRSWARFVTWCWARGFYAGILAPWRHGKSVCCTIRFALYELGQNPESRIRIVSGDDTEAMLRVASIRRYLEQSVEYRMVFPHVRPAELGEWTKHRIMVKRKSVGPDPSLEAAGVFTAEAGGGNDLILLDDLVTYQNSVLSPTARPKIHEALTSVWLRRVEPDTRVVLVGTSWHHQDAYQRLRQENTGLWRWLIQSVSDDFSAIDCRVE
mgnify:CR=1 FL=1